MGIAPTRKTGAVNFSSAACSYLRGRVTAKTALKYGAVSAGTVGLAIILSKVYPEGKATAHDLGLGILFTSILTTIGLVIKGIRSLSRWDKVKELFVRTKENPLVQEFVTLKTEAGENNFNHIMERLKLTPEHRRKARVVLDKMKAAEFAARRVP